jgi:methionine-S-sulfoxide reductase
MKATFALGCFWKPDDYFSKLKGVKSTSAGYSGGKKKNPTYKELGDNTETVEIEFDPKIISFKELLKHFWRLHDPTYKQDIQYQSMIFYHSEKQKEEAEASLKQREEKLGKKIVTKIVKAAKFYLAEKYHQKYLQKKRLF